MATDQSGDPPENSDLVAWTDELKPLTHGGHQALGLVFQLPLAGSGVAGQDQWRFCLKCSALFWNGDPNFKGACPNGGGHDTFGLGDNFVLPVEPTSVQGQDRWRFCLRCAGLFWDGDEHTTGTCPAGATHVTHPQAFKFVIPTVPAATGGQSEWRFCIRCHGLFWNGEASKGLCSGSPGGGIHLRAITRDGTQTSQFDHFRAPNGSPLRYTGPLETPNGAFSFDGVMYVFAGISPERWSHIARPENPAYGDYLFSKRDPSQPGPWNVEFLFSPRLGMCAQDASISSFDSHNVLGHLFVVNHDLPPSPSRVNGFRCCGKCGGVFPAAAPHGGVCQGGGPHAADPAVPEVFVFEHDIPEDEQNQSNWRTCGACQALYWAVESTDTGLCPAAGQHQPTEPVLRVPHVSIRDDGFHQEHWRFCRKCFCLFWNGDDTFGGVCAVDGGPHERAGFDFLIRHHTAEIAGLQGGWRLCVHCGVLFSERGAQPRPCPAATSHDAIGWEFTLDEAGPETLTIQTHWRQCTKCTALYFDGFPDRGRCPSDGQGHQADDFQPEFQLLHNPGVDANNRGNLQFCLRCHGLVRTDQPHGFPWVAPVVVDNADHPILQRASGQGLVMIGYDWRNFHLAWMPLSPSSKPRLDTVQYFHAGQRTWHDVLDNSPGYELFAHPFPGQYTHVSALWLRQPRCWVVLFSSAEDTHENFNQPIIARFSTDLLTWSKDVPVFHPATAKGVWMHDPQGPDAILKMPPSQPPGQNNPGWPYGAFILERYTIFDEDSRVLDLHYLMSTSSPYQVHLMHTLLRLPDPIVG